MESKGTFFILIIVVAVLTIALAAMAGYLFLVQGPSNNKSEDHVATAAHEETYTEEQLKTKALFESKKYFNLKSTEGSKTIAIIQAGVNIIHPKEIKGVKSIEEKFTLYQPKMKQLIIKYFLGVMLEDVKKPDAMDTASKVLTKELNDLLNAGEKEKNPKVFVVEVVFDDWVAQ